MSKEYEALNIYIEQQQARINELMQVVMMLETRNKILEEENKKLESKNKKLVSDNKNTKGINRVDLGVDLERTIEIPVERNLKTDLINSKERIALRQKKTVINGGFTTRKQTPEE
jgi:hypothetical protein